MFLCILFPTALGVQGVLAKPPAGNWTVSTKGEGIRMRLSFSAQMHVRGTYVVMQENRLKTPDDYVEPFDL